jgi:hypothetical protein
MLTSQRIGGSNGLVDRIDDIIDVTRNVLRYKRNYNYIDFTDDELRGLLDNIIVSWQSIKHGIDKNIHNARDEFFNDLQSNYESIANLITVIILPNIGSISLTEEEELYEMTMILEMNRIYIPQLLILLDKKVDGTDLEAKFYTGLLAHNEEEVEASIKAITLWCHLKSGHESITDVPQKLIDEFVDIIKNIRQPAFNILIKQLNFLIIQVPAVFKSEQYDVIIDSLVKLEILTRIPIINNVTDNDETFTGFCKFEEFPDYRAYLSEITATIVKNIQQEKINVSASCLLKLKDLQNIFISDVFPEVIKPWINISIN